MYFQKSMVQDICYISDVFQNRKLQGITRESSQLSVILPLRMRPGMPEMKKT